MNSRLICRVRCLYVNVSTQDLSVFFSCILTWPYITEIRCRTSSMTEHHSTASSARRVIVVFDHGPFI